MENYSNLNIKNWSVEDRPREKLENHGVHTLSDAEILAIIIGSGTKNMTALEVSRNILHQAGNDLGELGRLDLHELIKFRGIGKAKAISILAALELGRRRNISIPTKRIKIASSKDAFDMFQPVLGDLKHEEFWVLLLNRSNKMLEKIKISQGGISGTVIDTRIILKQALDRFSSSIILCHNHPSGNKSPSKADMDITNRIGQAAKIMDISLLDHIIIANKTYFSFADEGMM